MTTKEKVIRESIIRVETRLAKINKDLNASPLSDLIDIRREAQALLDKNKTVAERTSDEFTAQIEELSKKEKQCVKMAKELTGRKMSELIDEKVTLQRELIDLNNELYRIEWTKSKNS